jgi:hypothetical protein
LGWPLRECSQVAWQRKLACGGCRPNTSCLALPQRYAGNHAPSAGNNPTNRSYVRPPSGGARPESLWPLPSGGQPPSATQTACGRCRLGWHRPRPPKPAANNTSGCISSACCAQTAVEHPLATGRVLQNGTMNTNISTSTRLASPPVALVCPEVARAGGLTRATWREAGPLVLARPRE